MFLISITVLSRAAIGKELTSQLRTAAPHAQMQMPITRKRGDETTRDKRRGTDTQRDNSTQTHMWKKILSYKIVCNRNEGNNKIFISGNWIE